MYPRIPRELVADPLGSAEHSVGTTNVRRLLAARLRQGLCCPSAGYCSMGNTYADIRTYVVTYILLT